MKQTSDKLEFVEMSAFWRLVLFWGSFLVGSCFLGWYFGIFFLYLMGVVGLLMVISGEIETITFDKNLGHLTIKRHKPFITKTKLIKHLLQDISGVEIQEMSSGSNLYCVCIVLDSSKRPVRINSSFSTGLRNKQEKAEVIAAFLNIRNYGLDGFPRPQISTEQLQWETVEEEIAHWKTAIESDANDANALMKLGSALMLQDKTKNKEQVMSYLKQAEDLFKSQGYDEEATQAATMYSVAYWGMPGK
jgi:hypothetical protein